MPVIVFWCRDCRLTIKSSWRGKEQIWPVWGTMPTLMAARLLREHTGHKATATASRGKCREVVSAD